MGLFNKKGIPIITNFDIHSNLPIDSRFVVETIEELNRIKSENAAYEGMNIYCIETKHFYFYDGYNFTINNTKDKLLDHSSNKNNPHSVTPSQIGAISSTGNIEPDKIPIFSDSNGNIKNSGFTIKSSVPENAKFTDTVYTHPTTHPASMIVEDTSHRFVSDTEKSTWNTKVDKVEGKGLSTNDYTTLEKTKLNGIETGAEVNQNTFSNIKIGSNTISADSKTDTLELLAGSNIILSSDTTNDKITITAKDTIYTHPSYTEKSTGLYKIVVDNQGHISSATSVTKNDITALGIPSQDTNTHYSSKNIVAGTSTSTTNTTSALTNGNVYLIEVENGSVVSSHKISGSGSVYVTTDSSGNIIITGVNTTYNVVNKSSNGLTPRLPDETSTSKFLRQDGTWSIPPDTNTTYNIATTSVSGLMSTTDKTKLDGIESGANKYIHPTSHPANIITQDSTHKFVSDQQISNWDNKISVYFAQAMPSDAPPGSICFITD